MNWDALAAIAELVGALGVIATLVYLTIQIRQNTKSTNASMFQDRQNMRVNWLQQMSDRETAEMYDLGIRDQQLLDDAGRMQFLGFALSQLIQVQVAYRLYKDGHIPERDWLVDERTISAVKSYPGYANFIESAKLYLDADFIEFIDAAEPGAAIDYKDGKWNLEPQTRSRDDA